MLKHYRILPALAGAALSLLLAAVPAQAAGPATVTVRVVGSSNQTVVPLTQVTTNATPVVKDGNSEDSCTGTSVAGALQLATEVTHGSWGGTWERGEYTVEAIDGISYPFSKPPFYWSFWIDNKPASSGVCGVELNNGDSILFFVGCYGATKGECPEPPPNVLAIEAPATAEVGKPVTVTVLSYPNEGGEPKPAVGATVVGGGDADALPTDERGQTTLMFGGDGKYTLYANGDGSVEGSTPIPAEAFICAHEGDDGTCGTPAPPSTIPGTPKPPTTSVPTSTPQVAVAKIAGIKNGRVYTRRSAPRALKGTVAVPAGELLRKVQVSLERRYRGHCSDFDGRRARFVRIKCRRAAAFFPVGAKSAFSYLLPARLPRGRYTYEIEAVDGAGQATGLTDGVSRVVFDVK
jgi:hypothetical protein